MVISPALVPRTIGSCLDTMTSATVGYVERLFGRSRDERGAFNLSEQMVTMIIGLTLFTLPLAGLKFAISWAKTTACVNNLQNIETALELYELAENGLPASGAVTSALFTPADNSGNRYLKATPVDPAAAKTANYQFTDNTANGVVAYTVVCPSTTHDGATTLLMNGGSITAKTLKFVSDTGLEAE